MREADQRERFQAQESDVDAMREQWRIQGQHQRVVPAPYYNPFPMDRDLPPPPAEDEFDENMEFRHQQHGDPAYWPWPQRTDPQELLAIGVAQEENRKAMAHMARPAPA